MADRLGMNELSIQKTRTDASAHDPPCADSPPLLTIETVPEAPTAEKDLALYTKARLSAGLAFAEARLKSTRRVTPRSAQFLREYREFVKKALDADETGDGKNELLILIRASEKQMNDQLFLCGDKTAQDEERDPRLIKLQEYQYFARYADYFAHETTRLRSLAKADKSEGHDLIDGRHYWTDIWNDVLKESIIDLTDKPTGELMKDLQAEGSKRTTMALKMASSSANIDPGVMVTALRHYAERNNWVHTNLTPLIEEGRWEDLKKKILLDLQELDMFIPLSKQADLHAIRTCLEGFRDRYFTVPDGADTNTSLWIKGPEIDRIVSERKERKLAADEKDERRKEHARNTLKKQQKKRVASTEVPRGSENARSPQRRVQSDGSPQTESSRSTLQVPDPLHPAGKEKPDELP
ncbi:MAG: hypothetical protein M1817_003121 [Caeruleum heppii]|nr:MAG: hypothetical protein M1817_003121 [Caeruleum heppii]